MEALKCPNCGANINTIDEYYFCPFCGTAIPKVKKENEYNITNNHKQVTVVNNFKIGKHWKAIIVCFTIIIILVLLAVFPALRALLLLPFALLI